MKTWDGLNAEEIASIPRDEYCFQKIERILRERNALKELSDDEIHEVSKLNDVWIEQEDGSIKLSPYKFAKELLKKASEK